MTLPVAPAEAPISDDDATIAAALERASVPTLLLGRLGRRTRRRGEARRWTREPDLADFELR